MRHLLKLIVVLVVVVSCATAKDKDWQKLIDQGKKAEALKMCSGALNDKSVEERVNAHKCLASLALTAPEVLRQQPNDDGQTALVFGYDPAGADEALKQIGEALKLAPDDVSLHTARLHIFENTGRYEEMAKALDESCTTLKERGSLSTWMAAPQMLIQQHQFRAAVWLLRVLDRQYPKSHDVVSALGVAFVNAKDKEQGIHYLKYAADLQPDSARDQWLLAEAYVENGQFDLADESYKKSLQLTDDVKARQGNTCIYAGFVENKLNDLLRACQLQTENCGSQSQSACDKMKFGASR